eukprot:scaffold30164_cov17-Tisochrysis_lutea.AAC.1
MYQDHPQFKTLLQCMSAEGRGAGGTGPTSGAGQQQQQQQQQQHPVLAAASVSPAEAMLAMLRSPRVLEAFGEVDVLGTDRVAQPTRAGRPLGVKSTELLEVVLAMLRCPRVQDAFEELDMLVGHLSDPTVVVEQEQQQQRQQQEVGGPPSTGSYTSFKTRETGGAQKVIADPSFGAKQELTPGTVAFLPQTPTAEHGPGTDATTPKRMGAQGREPVPQKGRESPPTQGYRPE